MATSKRVRPVEGFYRSVEDSVPIRAKKLGSKQEKVDTEKMYRIEIIDRDKTLNRVKIHFVGYSSSFDEWRDAEEAANGDKSTKLGRVTHRFEPSIDSLTDRASSFFYNLGKAIKTALYSRKKESPDVRIEERVDQDIYDECLRNIGVLKKYRGKNVHVVNDNADISHVLGDKWFERIININGDFCYVVAGTTRFWLNEKRPLKEFFYIADHLLENQISNELQIIFTFVRGDGVKAEYKTSQWKESCCM